MPDRMITNTPRGCTRYLKRSMARLLGTRYRFFDVVLNRIRHNELPRDGRPGYKRFVRFAPA
jgi:hypothetical protein